ncbi:MAG: acyl-CoA dehydrogenase family protein, partial [Cyanobacteria bacterium]|nr:acyl-CoA dehydrogenase family protein [Cyanobacteriota bacterium]
MVSTSTTSQNVLPYGEFLSEEHHAIREMVRNFATKEIAPKAAEVDREAKFPEETFKKLGELG